MIKSKLILGTVQFGLDYGINNSKGKPSLNEVFDTLSTAHANGIKILDTAEAYGNSQNIIGEFHKKNPDKIFKIITKFVTKNTTENFDIISKIKDNCAILNVKNLYAYMFHNFDGFKTNKSIYTELANAKSQNLIQKIGISLYTNQEIEYVLNSDAHFDIIQVPFNLLDNAKQRKDIFVKAKLKGIEIHTRSVFLQGLFFMNSESLIEKNIDLSNDISLLQNIIHKYDLDISSLALQYAYQKDYIDYLVIGVDNSQQLKNNISSLKTPQSIPDKKIDEIDVKNKAMLNPSNWK